MRGIIGEVNLTITLITKHSEAKHENGKWEKKHTQKNIHENTQINIPIYPETSMGETKGLRYSSSW